MVELDRLKQLEVKYEVARRRVQVDKSPKSLDDYKKMRDLFASMRMAYKLEGRRPGSSTSAVAIAETASEAQPERKKFRLRWWK